MQLEEVIPVRNFLTIFSIIGLIIMSISIVEPFRSEPPPPTVTTDQTQIPITQGSYCWSGFSSTKCVNKDINPTYIGRESTPITVSPSEVIHVYFKMRPLSNALNVEQWSNEKSKVNVQVKDNAIIAPKERGKYVYFLKATWQQGYGNYAFSVSVE